MTIRVLFILDFVHCGVTIRTLDLQSTKICYGVQHLDHCSIHVTKGQAVHTCTIIKQYKLVLHKKRRKNLNNNNDCESRLTM